MGGSKVKRQALSRPGLALRRALQYMEQYLPPRPGGAPDKGPSPRVVEYLTTVLEKGERELGIRNARELRTLAQAIDAIIRGDLAFAADTLVQRFKAVETATLEGGWGLAQHLELIPSQKITSVSETERRQAADQELREGKLRKQALEALGRGGRRQNRRGNQSRDG